MLRSWSRTRPWIALAVICGLALVLSQAAPPSHAAPALDNYRAPLAQGIVEQEFSFRAYCNTNRPAGDPTTTVGGLRVYHFNNPETPRTYSWTISSLTGGSSECLLTSLWNNVTAKTLSGTATGMPPDLVSFQTKTETGATCSYRLSISDSGGYGHDGQNEISSTDSVSSCPASWTVSGSNSIVGFSSGCADVTLVSPCGSGATSTPTPTNTATATRTFTPTSTRTATPTATRTPTTRLPPQRPTAIPAGLGDLVWYDLDADGVQDAGEPGAPGVTVRLLDGGGNVSATTQTDATGNYGFPGLTPGDYRIEVVLPAGDSFSPPNQGGDATLDSDVDPATGRSAVTTLTAGEQDLSWDAGLVPPRDFGDLPDGPYQTHLASGGPLHRIVPGFHLGASEDSESDGQPNSTATGDDSAATGGDDEDGVLRLAAPNSPSGGWTDGNAADGNGCKLQVTVAGGSGDRAGLAGLRGRAGAGRAARCRRCADPRRLLQSGNACRHLRRTRRDVCRQRQPQHPGALPVEFCRWPGTEWPRARRRGGGSTCSASGRMRSRCATFELPPRPPATYPSRCCSSGWRSAVSCSCGGRYGWSGRGRSHAVNEEARADAARPYEPPAIVYEAPLEVRAGTPLGIVDASGRSRPSRQPLMHVGVAGSGG